MAHVITALGRLRSAREVSDAVGQTLVTAAGGTTVLLADTLNLTSRVVQTRMEGNHGMAAGDGVSDRNVWGKPFGTWANQGAKDGLSGYKARSGGVVVGADAAIGTADRLGVAFIYANVDLDSKGDARQHADVDLYQLMAYGSRNLNQSTDINWQANLGVNKTGASRAISFGGLQRTAQSSYDGVNAHLGAGIGRQIALGEASHVAPSLRFDYTVIKNQAYNERGAGALDLQVSSETFQQLNLSSEIKLTRSVGKDKSVLLVLGAGYDLLKRQNAIVSAFAGGGSAFTTTSADPAKGSVRAGSGFNSVLADGLDFSARYDVEARSKFTNQTLSFKLRKEF